MIGEAVLHYQIIEELAWGGIGPVNRACETSPNSNLPFLSKLARKRISSRSKLTAVGIFCGSRFLLTNILQEIIDED